MPYQWTAERERLMLLLAVSSSNLKPSADTWAVVARILGEGLTSSAVSQKYYKLRKDAVKFCNGNASPTSPATPAKRKAPTDDSKVVKQKSPTKRTMKFTMKEEDLDGERCSVFSSCQEQSGLSVYPEYQMPFMPEQYPQFGNEQVPTKAGEVEGDCFWLGSGQSGL